MIEILCIDANGLWTVIEFPMVAPRIIWGGVTFEPTDERDFSQRPVMRSKHRVGGLLPQPSGWGKAPAPCKRELVKHYERQFREAGLIHDDSEKGTGEKTALNLDFEEKLSTARGGQEPEQT